MTVAMCSVLAPQLGAQTMREAIPMKVRIPTSPRVTRYAAYSSSSVQRPWYARGALRGFYADLHHRAARSAGLRGWGN